MPGMSGECHDFRVLFADIITQSSGAMAGVLNCVDLSEFSCEFDFHHTVRGLRYVKML